VHLNAILNYHTTQGDVFCTLCWGEVLQAKDRLKPLYGNAGKPLLSDVLTRDQGHCPMSSQDIRTFGQPIYSLKIHCLLTVGNWLDALPYLTLRRAGVLLISAKASSRPNAHPHINQRVTETCRFLQTGE